MDQSQSKKQRNNNFMKKQQRSKSFTNNLDFEILNQSAEILSYQQELSIELDLKDVQNELLSLFTSIYLKGLKYCEMKKELSQILRGINELSTFFQILNDSITSYLKVRQCDQFIDFKIIQELILDNILKRQYEYQYNNKDQINQLQYTKQYFEIISILLEQYQIMINKSVEIQKVIDQFMEIQQKKSNPIIQHVNCSELHHTLFTEKILKNQYIKHLLDNLVEIFQQHKQYQQTFYHYFQSLIQINSIRKQKYKPSIQQTTLDKTKITQSQSQKLIIKTNDDQDQSNSKIINQNQNENENISSKKKKKGQNPSKNKKRQDGLDEVRLFEEQIEKDFELAKNIQKIEINWPDQWIDKLKQQLYITLKKLNTH